MSEKRTCLNCNMKNSLHLERCQYCGQLLAQQANQASDEDFQILISNEDNGGAAMPKRESSISEDSTHVQEIPEQVLGVGQEDFKKLLYAQNRTTHAIRSIAVFFFINIFTSIFGGFWILVAIRDLQTCDYSCGPANVMFNIGAGVVGVGFLVAMIAGLRELSQSKT